MVVVAQLLCFSIATLPPTATRARRDLGLRWLSGNVGATSLGEQKSWVNLAIPGGCEDFRDGCGCEACLGNIDAAWRDGIASLARMPQTGVFVRPTRARNGSDVTVGGLADGWQAKLQKWASEVVTPRLANGSVVGVFLGDEICCHNSSCWHGQLYPMSAYLRQLLGAKAILYTNECQDSLTGGNYTSHGHKVGPPLDRVAPALDILSVDLYAGYTPGSNGVEEVNQDRAFFDAQVFPRLWPHQSAFAVPGVFACSNLSLISLVESQRHVVDKLQGYWEWAKAEPRLVGLYPWHYTNRSSAQASSRCDMRLGAVAMPRVLAKLEEMASWINRSTSIHAQNDGSTWR